MVKLFIKNINDISLNELNISKLTPYRREKFDRLIDERSKLQSLTAGLMLNEYISDKEIKLNEYGKPYVEGGPFFSLSHSGDYVALAVSDKYEVGCDIERIRDCDFAKLARLVFIDNELGELKAAEDERDSFFELWTKKEAFIKCIGEGFHYSPKSLDLSGKKPYTEFNDKKLFFKEYMLPGYKIMLCSQDDEYEETNLL